MVIHMERVILALKPSSGILRCALCIISNQKIAPADSQAVAPWGSNGVSMFYPSTVVVVGHGRIRRKGPE